MANPRDFGIDEDGCIEGTTLPVTSPLTTRISDALLKDIEDAGDDITAYEKRRLSDLDSPPDNVMVAALRSIISRWCPESGRPVG